MSTIDRSLSPSPSGNKLSKLRLGRKGKGKADNVSSQSLVSTVSTDGDEQSSSPRKSVDVVLDKLKPSARRSSDDKRLSIDASRLSKLVPNKIKRKKGNGNSNDASPERRPVSYTHLTLPTIYSV